jgi:hypothetical protein
MNAAIIFALMISPMVAEANDVRDSVDSGLAVKENRLSASFDDLSLETVLTELEKQSGVRVFVSGTSHDEAVSAHFSYLPLDEGIKNLLQGKNYTLRYQNTDRGYQVAEVRVLFSAGAGPFMPLPNIHSSATAINTTIPQEFSPSVDTLLYNAIHAKDPVARVSALQRLEKSSDDKKLSEAVAFTLRDGDPRVRTLSLQMVQRGAGVEPSRLQDMARQEPDAKLRAQAWDELLDRSENTLTSKNYLGQAKQDADPGIKAWAERKLEELQDDDPDRHSTQDSAGA